MTALPKASKQDGRKRWKTSLPWTHTTLQRGEAGHIPQGRSVFDDRQHSRVEQTWVLESGRLKMNPRSATC